MDKPQAAKEIILSLTERFQQDKSEEAGLSTRIHFKIEGHRGGEFTVRVKDREIEVKEGLHGEPLCIVKARDEVYENIEWGRENPQMALLFGKITLSNIPEILKFTAVFCSLKRFYESE